MTRSFARLAAAIGSTALVLSALSVASAAQAADQSPAATPAPFYVGLEGSTLVVQASGATSPFGLDETLRIDRTATSTTVSMIGEDAIARLMSVDATCGPVDVLKSTITCSVPVSTAVVDYSKLSTYTQTYIDGDLPVNFTGGGGEDDFYAGSGADTLDGGGGPDVLFGDPEEGPYGNDTITGGPGKDVIDAFGGINKVYAKDGEADTRVQCADVDIPGSSGQATWDVGLDKPIKCDALVEVPVAPRNVTAEFTAWSDLVEPTAQLLIRWDAPLESDPTVDSYHVDIAFPNSEYVYRIDRTPTEQEIALAVFPPTWSPGEYIIRVSAVNAAGRGPATTATTATLAANAPAVPKATAAALLDARQGVKVSWTKPALPANLQIDRYELERRVQADWRSGAEWLLVAAKSAAQTFHVDVCLPPEVRVDYRVRAVYRDRRTGETDIRSAWTQTAEVTTAPPMGLMGTAPSVSGDFGGLQEISPEAPPMATVSVKVNGTKIDTGLCYGVGLWTWGAYQASGGSLAPFTTLETIALPRGTGSFQLSRTLSSQSLGSLEGLIGGVAGYEVWLLDEQWQSEYGRGFDLSRARQYQMFGARPLIRQTNRMYFGNIGPRVPGLTATIDGDGILSATWSAPSSGSDSIVNWRDRYEVCVSSPGVFVQRDYPTTLNMRCALFGKSVTSVKFGPEYFCPDWSPRTPTSCAGYPLTIGVRPWVGAAMTQLTTYSTSWVDWNSSAFRYRAVRTPIPSPSVAAAGSVRPAAIEGECLPTFSPLQGQATGAAVPCEGEHQAEIFGTGTAPDDFGLPSEAVMIPQYAAQWCAAADGTSATDRMLNYLGISAATIPTRLAIGVSLPTDEEWLAGVREVGCAMAVVDAPANALPQATSWSGRAPTVTANSGAQWVLGCSPSKPVSGSAVSNVACTTGSWLLVDQSEEVSGNAGTPYPGAALQAAADAACQPVAGAWSGNSEITTSSYAAVLPTEVLWTSGANGASCWISLSAWSGEITLTPAPIVPADATITVEGPMTAYAELNTQYDIELVDGAGAPLAYAPVDVDVSGEGSVNGGATATVTTDAQGLATVNVQAGKTGTFTVSATAQARPEITTFIEVSIEAAPQPTPQITISGKKGKVGKKKGVIVSGRVIAIEPGSKVVPYYKVNGAKKYKKAKTIKVSASGTFTWKKATGKPVTVYMRYAKTKSNVITVKP